MHVTLLIPPEGSVTADQFVEWVFLAENWDPNSSAAWQHKDTIRAAFVEHMGAETVEASALQYSAES